MMFAAAAGPAPNMVMEKSLGPPPTKSELAPVTHVRKLFPETWLWRSLDVSYVAKTAHVLMCLHVKFLSCICLSSISASNAYVRSSRWRDDDVGRSGWSGVSDGNGCQSRSRT